MSARKKIMISMIVILLLLTVGAYGYRCILFYRAFFAGLNGKWFQLFVHDSRRC